MFQSTSAPIGADDSATTSPARAWPCFNPRPPRSERTTSGCHAPRGGDVVSIHVRPDRSGRHTILQKALEAEVFQSTSAPIGADDL